jgi:hypothetical protein
MLIITGEDQKLPWAIPIAETETLLFQSSLVFQIFWLMKTNNVRLKTSN